MTNNKDTSKDKVDLSSEQMRRIFREMADFIALYETIDEKLTAREIALENKLIASEKALLEQLGQIKSVFKDFQSIMTEAGAARWRIAAENALHEGKQHLDNLTEVASNITQSIQDGCNNLNQTTSQSIAKFNLATNTFRAEEFKNSAYQGSELIKNTSISQINRALDLVKWFHWKNLTMAFVLTLFVVFLSGLYVGDEWPWELHSQAVKERSAGKTLLNAWPHLSLLQQQTILNDSKLGG